MSPDQSTIKVSWFHEKSHNIFRYAAMLGQLLIRNSYIIVIFIE